MRYWKYIIAIVVVTVLSKVFIYTYANAIPNKLEDYVNWEFVAYDHEINFYYVDPNLIKEILVEFLGAKLSSGVKCCSYFIKDY